MDIGYIKLFRQMTEWEWYDDPNTKSLFIHLLLMANYETKSWKGIEVPRAHLITGRKKLAETLGMTEREVRTCIERLKTTKEIAITTTRGFSLWHVINYERYQSEGPEKRPQIRHANDHETTTTKKVRSKEDKNNKERISKSFFSYQEGNEFQEPFWFIYSNFIIEKREVLDECFKMGQWIEDHDDKPRYNWKSFVSNWLLKSYKRRQKPLEMQQPVEPALPQPPPSEKSESFHITDLLQEEEQVDA